MDRMVLYPVHPLIFKIVFKKMGGLWDTSPTGTAPVTNQNKLAP